ncbi:MAG: ABC transporter permease [Candidatus Dormibacteraeota bacterium]|nr:ABC transporter permease [Candidatus Dormibacteraeota bacterium]
MSPVPAILVFAKLTIWEASRRKLLLAIALLTLAVIAFTGWGFAKIPDQTGRSGQPLSPLEVKVIASQLLILVSFVFSGVLALSAVLVASPSISSEVESHQALALLARPVRRADYVLGKWLGLAVLVLGYAAASGALEMVVVAVATGYVPPNPLGVLAAIAGEALVLLTLALALSTRLAGMTGGIIALVLWFVAWIGGIVEGLGQGFDNATLSAIGLGSRLLLPTDALWRGAVFSMEPATLVATAQQLGPVGQANPFFAAQSVAPAMLVWAAIWVLGVLALGLWSFRSREV